MATVWRRRHPGVATCERRCLVVGLLRERWYSLTAGLLGALPSVTWTAHGAGFLTDDWGVYNEVRTSGFLHSVWQFSFFAPARPGAGLYYSGTSVLFGLHPSLYASVLTLLNGVVAAEVCLLAGRVFPRRLAIVTTLFWIVLPNRGSTRLWLVLAPDVLALALLLAAGLCLTKKRFGWSVVLLICGALCYEAVLPPGVAMIAAWVLTDRRQRRKSAAIGIPPLLTVAGFLYLRSPKRGGHRPFDNWKTVFPAQMGRGIFGFGGVARVGGGVILLATAIALVRLVVPSLRPGFRSRHRYLLAGYGIGFLGAASFFVGGFPFATDGIYDRGNLVADLGTALVLGCICEGVLEVGDKTQGGRQVAVASVAVVAALMGALNSIDVRDYSAAVRDGNKLLAQLHHDLANVPQGGVRVEPALPDRNGVAMFIEPGDLNAAEAVRRRQNVPPIYIESFVGLPRSSEPSLKYRYDRISRQLFEISP